MNIGRLINVLTHIGGDCFQLVGIRAGFGKPLDKCPGCRFVGINNKTGLRIFTLNRAGKRRLMG